MSLPKWISLKKMINITFKDIQPAVVIKIYQGYQIDP